MKILYIEDDLKLAEIVIDFLNKNYYTVDHEVDGAKALSVASMRFYDLMIIDINIPSKNGLDVCKDLRSINNNTPIIFLTSNKDDESLLNSFKIGGDDYIKKPFNIDELLLRIKNILKRSNKNYIKDIISFEDFNLDINSNKLFFKEHKIYLTKKEFNLLELFFRNKNTLFSREEIFERIWDFNSNPFSNTIEVFLKNIRKKIKKYTNKKIIKNIKGVGYYIGNLDL